MRRNSPVETVSPSLRSSPTATTLADAPNGVMFPPRLAPSTIPKTSGTGSAPTPAATSRTSGIIVVM